MAKRVQRFEAPSGVRGKGLKFEFVFASQVQSNVRAQQHRLQHKAALVKRWAVAAEQAVELGGRVTLRRDGVVNRHASVGAQAVH